MKPPSNVRSAGYTLWEHRLKIPVIMAALGTIPVTLLQVEGYQHQALTAADWLIWGTFTTEYIVLLVLTDNRASYIRSNWFNACIILLSFPLLPEILAFVRVGRLVRLLRLSRIAAAGAKGLQASRAILGRQGVLSLLVVAGLMVVTSAGILTLAESSLQEAGYGSNVWWSAVTLLILRYAALESAWADAANLALIVIGVALRAVLAASIAAYFIGQERQTPLEQKLEHVEQLVMQIAATKDEHFR